MRLEKVTLNYNDFAFTGWSSIHSGLTPIDMFCNGEFLWGNRVLEKFLKFGVHIGKNYGTRGITVQDMMNTGADANTIYCISVEEFSQLSNIDRYMLLTNYVVMICDLAEGGFHFSELFSKYGNNMNAFTKNEPVRCCFVCTSGMENFNFIAGVRNTVNIPYFMLLTSWECHSKALIPDPKQFMKPVKSALVPVHKPRMHRIKMLAQLDKMNLLNVCDWSLTVNQHSGGEFGDFQHTPNVSLARFNFLTTDPVCKSFYEKYQHQLPKSLVNNDISEFSECIPLPVQLAGKYQWYVSCETYTHMQFVTEKTYKAFMCGLPVLLVADANTAKSFSKDTGFELPYHDRYDDYGISDQDHNRFKHIAELIAENPAVHKDTIMHNFNLINNIEWQVVSSVEPVLEMYEYCPSEVG